MGWRIVWATRSQKQAFINLPSRHPKNPIKNHHQKQKHIQKIMNFNCTASYHHKPFTAKFIANLLHCLLSNIQNYVVWYFLLSSFSISLLMMRFTWCNTTTIVTDFFLVYCGTLAVLSLLFCYCWVCFVVCFRCFCWSLCIEACEIFLDGNVREALGGIACAIWIFESKMYIFEFL